jgi:hypothetical protein
MFGLTKSSPEVLRRSFTVAELFDLIENAGVRKPLRRFQPNHFAVFVSPSGAVVAVTRSKRNNFSEVDSLFVQFPGTAYFLAVPGQFFDLGTLEAKIMSCAAALRDSPGRAAGGGAWLCKDGEWVPSIGTQLMHQDRNQ